MQTLLPVDSVCIGSYSLFTRVCFSKSIKREKIYWIKIRPQNIPTMQFDRHMYNTWPSLTRNLKVANKDLRYLIGY